MAQPRTLWPRPNTTLRHYAILGRKLYPAEHILGMELAQRVRPCRPGLWADLSSAQSSGSCSEQLPDLLASRLHGELQTRKSMRERELVRAHALSLSFVCGEVRRLLESVAGPNLSGSALAALPDPLAPWICFAKAVHSAMPSLYPGLGSLGVRAAPRRGQVSGVYWGWRDGGAGPAEQMEDHQTWLLRRPAAFSEVCARRVMLGHETS